MAPPVQTPEDRDRALAAAHHARAARAAVKDRLKAGTTTLPDVLTMAAGDATIGKMKVANLLESMPGIGKVRARQIMERLSIADNRRISGLGTNQREALEREFTPA